MATDAERLRRNLGESIPSAGTDEDTLFSDQTILDLLSEAEDDLNLASYNGWIEKMGIYVNLVNTAEGNATKEMSDLFKHAKDMVSLWKGRLNGGGTKIHDIVRPTGSALQ